MYILTCGTSGSVCCRRRVVSLLRTFQRTVLAHSVADRHFQCAVLVILWSTGVCHTVLYRVCLSRAGNGAKLHLPRRSRAIITSCLRVRQLNIVRFFIIDVIICSENLFQVGSILSDIYGRCASQPEYHPRSTPVWYLCPPRQLCRHVGRLVRALVSGCNNVRVQLTEFDVRLDAVQLFYYFHIKSGSTLWHRV